MCIVYVQHVVLDTSVGFCFILLYPLKQLELGQSLLDTLVGTAFEFIGHPSQNWVRVYRTPQQELGQSLQDTLVGTGLEFIGHPSMNWARVYRTPQLELGQSLQDTLVRTLLRILVRFYITGNPIWNLKFHPLLNSNSEPGNMNDMPMHMKTMCRQHQTRSQPVPSQPPATIPTITSMSAQHRFYARNVIKYLFINRILAQSFGCILNS